MTWAWMSWNLERRKSPRSQRSPRSRSRLKNPSHQRSPNHLKSPSHRRNLSLPRKRNHGNIIFSFFLIPKNSRVPASLRSKNKVVFNVEVLIKHLLRFTVKLNSRLLYIWINYCQKNISELGLKHVANAMKVLHACNYKSVKAGLFFNWLVAKSIVKFIMLMLKSWSILY